MATHRVAICDKARNDECQMTKPASHGSSAIRASALIRHLSFVIRHLSAFLPIANGDEPFCFTPRKRDEKHSGNPLF
jgi:hypothetical protein